MSQQISTAASIAAFRKELLDAGMPWDLTTELVLEAGRLLLHDGLLIAGDRS